MKKKRCLSVVIISLLLGISCFIMAGCANKDNEDKDDTKIEQNLDKKEDGGIFPSGSTASFHLFSHMYAWYPGSLPSPLPAPLYTLFHN